MHFQSNKFKKYFFLWQYAADSHALTIQNDLRITEYCLTTRTNCNLWIFTYSVSVIGTSSYDAIQNIVYNLLHYRNIINKINYEKANRTHESMVFADLYSTYININALIHCIEYNISQKNIMNCSLICENTSKEEDLNTFKDILKVLYQVKYNIRENNYAILEKPCAFTDLMIE